MSKTSLCRNFILASFSLIIGTVAPIPARSEAASPGPGGTYTDWWFPDDGGFGSIEWTFLPVKDPRDSLAQKGLLHYYAYNFGLVNSSPEVGRGYAGFQSNGIFKFLNKNLPVGKVINFSIWGSNGGVSPSGLVNPANSESSGYQIMLPYPWVEGRRYRFRLSRSSRGEDELGIWWRLMVIDLDGRKKTLVGDIRVPATIDGRRAELLEPRTSMFGEDLHWWRTINGAQRYECSDFEPSAMAALDVTADGDVRPVNMTTRVSSGETFVSEDGFRTISCDVSVRTNGYDVLHKLGYWDKRHPGFSKSLSKPKDDSAASRSGFERTAQPQRQARPSGRDDRRLSLSSI